MIDSIIRAEGGMPRSARRLDNSEWVPDLVAATVAMREATGWHNVIDTPQPADTPTDTYLRTVELVAGQPKVVWVAQPKPVEQIASETATMNRTAIETNLTADLAVMQTIIDAANPAIVDIAALRAAARERKDIARMLRRVGRHIVGAFDAID